MSGKRTGRGDDRYRTDGGQDDLTDLQGIGPARADRLRDAGFESFEDIRVATRDDLVDVLGPELTDQVLEQVGNGGQSNEGADTAESGDSGPTVPPADESEGGSGSGTDESDDTGPSVPSSSGSESDAGGEAGGQTAHSADQGTQTAGGDAGTPTTGTAGGTTVESTAQQGTSGASNGSNEDAILAGLVSFIIPGVGNMINGQTDRGVIILVIWIIWLIIGWGIGVFIIGSIIGFLTLGIGFLLVSLVVGLLEFLIHVLAAIDAYRGSKVVDNVTGKVNQVRGN